MNMHPSELFPGISDVPLVIAEIGGNHGGDLELAKEMVTAAAHAGAPAVKFQTYLTEELVAPDDPSFAAFEEEALTFDEFRNLATHCQEQGVLFLSTPFGRASADLLEELRVPAYKIASGDLTHLPLLRYVAAKGCPILLSTGGATWEEIDVAVATLREVSEVELVLMHCTSAYPAPDEEANLRVLPALQQRYGTRVGFSDHTLGLELSLAGVALGAVVVEKHFTVDRSLPAGDNEMSILPEELDRLIRSGKRIARALGSPERAPTPIERELLPVMRRSLVLRRSLPAGALIRAEDLAMVRPGTGIPPGDLDRVVGKKVAQALPEGAVLSWDDVRD